jgi:hypothetical protein
MNTQPRPARALTHPLWWVALATLAVNDHLLKGADVLPAGLTGKLSDFAGLLVAPVVLAALLRVRTGRGVALAHLATGLGFALINLSPAAAGAFESLMAHTPWPWAIVVDPSDLLALPMLAVSWVVLTPWMRRPVPTQALVARGAVVLGAWASVATSPPPEPMPPVGRFSDIQASFTIGNEGEQSRIVRIRALRAEVRLDCDALAADPAALLGRALFGPAEIWQLDAGRAMNAEPTNAAPRQACTALLIDGVGLPMRVLFFEQSEYPVWTLSSQSESGPRQLSIDSLGWAEHPVLYPLRRAEPEPAELACRLPEQGAGVAWTAPPGRTLLVQAVSTSPDGCHRLTVEDDGWVEPWYLCIGDTPLPFEVDDTLTVDTATDDLLVVSGARHTLTLAAGQSTTDGAYEISNLREQEGCSGSADTCGGFRMPLQVEFAEREGGLTRWLSSGESYAFEQVSVHLLRAEQAVIADPACTTAGTAPYFEIVSVSRR